MIKRKEFPQTDDYPASLSLVKSPRPARVIALLAMTALAFAAFWLGVRLHVPRLVARRPNPDLGPVVTARFFEMGQGCSLLLISPERHAVLIDAGTTLTGEQDLKAALQRAGVGALDAVIVTSCRQQAIGGMPRLLNTVAVRGPILIPVPIDQFKEQGGRAAELCVDAFSHRGLSAFVCQDYLETHPGLLGTDTSLSSRVVPGNPAGAEILRVQNGRSTLVDLANLTPSEEESALSLRGVLACDTLVIPAGDSEQAASHELLALSAARDVVVPLPQSREPNPVTISTLAAADARVMLMSQREPVVLGLAAQSDEAQEIKAPKASD